MIKETTLLKNKPGIRQLWQGWQGLQDVEREVEERQCGNDERNTGEDKE